MKKNITIGLLMFASLFAGCSEYEIEKDTFIDVYKEILTVREMIADSAEAEKTIESIYLKYEITDKLFKADYFFYAESEEFIEILDSVRDRVMRELAEIEISRDSLVGIDSEIGDIPVNNLNQMTDRDSVEKKIIQSRSIFSRQNSMNLDGIKNRNKSDKE
ncbi:MAG: hypothetical protein KAH48_06020 [Chlorobi bacterium]|nr:hypothetical protein [Chlorobiota bacterium]